MIIIPFIIIGVAVIVIFIILVKIIVAPKRVEHLAQMYNQRRIPIAVKLAKQILAKDNRNSDAHYYLGLCYLSENKPELALMELKSVNQIGLFEGAVRESSFRTTIADLYLRFNQLEEAQKEYLLLINLEPENPEYYYQAGKLFEARNHADKAVKYYRKTIELSKTHADAYARLGSILFRAKYLPEAKEALEQAVRLQPGNAHACFSLGKICKESRDFQTAIGYFEKSAKDGELKLKSIVEKATCLIAIGDLVRAEADLDRAIKISPDDAGNETLFARYLMAYCHEQARHYEDAILQWQKIQSKRPNFRDVPAKLAQYQDLQTDDRLKDYLTAGDDDFLIICRKIIEGLGMSIQDEKNVDQEFEFLAGESQTKWRNTKKLPTLFRFARETEPIEEPDVRSFHERIKNSNSSKGAFITSSTFSRGAREFAESRPIDLMDKDKLLSLLGNYVKG